MTPDLSWLERIGGVFRLDPATFEGIERDGRRAIRQAWAVVVGALLLSALPNVVRAVAAFGPAMESLRRELSPAEADRLRGIVVMSIAVRPVFTVLLGIAAWFAFAALVRWAGTTLLGAGPDACTPRQMRTLIGWACAPFALNVAGWLPVVGGFVGLVAAIWAAAAGIVAVRVALRVSTGRAVAAVAIAAGILALVLVVCLTAAWSAGVGDGAGS